ncbi:MAG: hypothetical protein ACR2I2_20020 [Bryobacteraceae bacterium]
MTTRKQTLANRRNALKSTGPTTKIGKQRISQNALVHGMRAHTTVLPGENSEEYEQLADLLRSQYQPEPGFEASLLERITHCLWRLQRGPQIEVGIFLAEQLRRIQTPTYVPKGPGEAKAVEFETQANASHPGALDLADAYSRIACLYRYEVQVDKLLRTNVELLERMQYVRKSGMDPYYLSKVKSFPAPSPRKPENLQPIFAKQSQFPLSTSKLNNLATIRGEKTRLHDDELPPCVERGGYTHTAKHEP